MILKPHSRLLFIGDSITDCGRRRPVGQGPSDHALGTGFVSLVDAALAANYPDYKITTLNLGVSGNTVRDLEARWQRDVLDLAPDTLVVKIGINDVWRAFGFAWQKRQHVPEENFRRTLDALIRPVRPQLEGLILMTPYYLEADRKEPMRAMMDRYGQAVRELAGEHRALLVDTQSAFDHVLAWTDPLELAHDRVHVNRVGHMILARALLQGIGYSWERSP